MGPGICQSRLTYLKQHCQNGCEMLELLHLFSFSGKPNDTVQMRSPVTKKRPNDLSPEEKLKAVLEAASLSDDQLGEFLRRKGLHETHLQQWRIQMLDGLGKLPKIKTWDNPVKFTPNSNLSDGHDTHETGARCLWYG